MAKILVVDDEEKFTKLYSTILMKEGYEVLTASGAQKGFDLAVAARPNLILLDIMMPSVDGAEALETLSEDARTKHIPVIFLTSLIKEGEADDAQGEVGGREYISKSAPNDKIVARVNQALSATQRVAT